jgi:hypothetical protein
LSRRSFGLLRWMSPISRSFGMDRGGPIDRYYIDSFLERHRADIKTLLNGTAAP